jgi:ribosomal protein S12 methylthiotransferase
MALQAEISAARLRARIGSELDVLVDAVELGVAVARSAADAPEIDGVVRIDDGERYAPGGFVAVRITGADEHDLTAVASG